MNHRPRWRSYLLLSRLSNLPTVWTNVLAGCVLGAHADEHLVIHLAMAMSALYAGGMFLNDALDRRFDAVARPERPIPRGDVSAIEGLAVGSALLGFGVAITMLLAPTLEALTWVLALTGAIVYYDLHHKQNPFAAVVMGVCRGFVYCVAAAAAGGVTGRTLMAAALLAGYVAGFSFSARRLGRFVPYFIAGISLFDAAVILAVSGHPGLAALAALGFPLTIFLQRFIPGD